MMEWKREWKPLLWIIFFFLACYYLPVGTQRFINGIMEALLLAKWYAREHVLLCLVPAFFIAGAIAVFIGKESVMKYLGAKANKVLSYGVASISGTILAVCSCTVLPLFAGIYQMGAGIGPATAFLYSGPAINILAIILTARVLGLEMGIARAVGAIAFSIVIGLCMHFVFRKEEIAKANSQKMSIPESEVARPLWQNVLYFASMVGILVFANWGKCQESSGLWYAIYSSKWFLTGVFSAVFAIILIAWLKLSWWKVTLAAIPVIVLIPIFPNKPVITFTVGIIGLSVITSTDEGETSEWFNSTWEFTKQILPLLLFGVLISGFLLGRPGNEGIIPSVWVSRLVGGNSVFANFFASIVGAFMYFATLTEVPILEALIGSGMGKGPALALLLAGPALSLPSMLVIRSVMGTKKTIVFVILVVTIATFTGVLYGFIF